MQTKNPFPWYAPRFWHGMPSTVWWPMLKKHRWQFDWGRSHFVTSVSLSTLITDPICLMQHALYQRRIASIQLAGPPVFVLGHWRSGTTLLHELLQLDDRFGSPNTYQCFAPWHFLLTEKLMTTFGNFLIPERRPMDNMKAGWRLPQEDEFALMALGAPSPYTRIAFPRDPADLDSLSSETMTGEKLERWKRAFEWFMKAITYRENKPLVLKSPTHTGRIALLHSLYPDAKFVHLSRHPHAMIPSTIKLWQSLSEVQGLQGNGSDHANEDFVFACFERMYEGYSFGKSQVPQDQLLEVTYESLIADPIKTVETIYSRLELGNFEPVREKLQQRMKADKDYKVNEWKLPECLAARIRQNCKIYCDQFGYSLP